MEEIKAPKKERKFLKAMGDVALTLFRDLVLGIGKKVINKVGNKRQGLAIALVMVAGVTYAAVDSIPYPITGNKQKLGWQTSGNGLVYRGTAADTVTKPSNYTNKDIKAYLLVDTVNNVMYSYIASKGGWQFNNSDTVIVNNNFSQPVDSLFFKTSVTTNNVDTAKMRWDSDLATVVLGMYDQVPNELGFKNFWLVKNQTGSTITKGSIVYANGTVGASGRITVAKFIANGSIDAKYLLGITAHDLSNGEDGYVISFGKIRKVNTDTFVAGSILYPSPTVAGVWTDVEPIAPNIDMPIGFCINSHANNGTIAIRVASGYKLHELHDLAISSPVDKASLYYKSSDGLWRDTTATLLVSDTASMLTNYNSRINSKLNISDTASMLTNYARKGTGGTVTNVTGTLPISVINNTTTPAISIADASASVSGVVTTGTQSFAGAKTFTAATIINGGLVVNEDGSSVGTFRVEGNNNTSLIQTSPNDDFVGIGRVPGNAFDVQGAVRFRTLTGNSTPTRIIGADATGDINQITLGTGLTISSGTLSATSTGTVTSVSAGSPANGLSVATGTTTPVISMALAASGTIGVVSAGTQVFSGSKTFEGLIGFQKALQRPYQSVTGSSASITTASTWIVVNHAGTVTLTFPSASASTGTEFHIKTITNNAVNSNDNNVVLLAGGSAQAGILSATAGKWATLVSDGSNWVIMQAN